MMVKYIDSNTFNSIQDKYISAIRRLLFLDYDGTLTPIARLPDLAVLSERTKNILKVLISDNRNTVVIISGRKREFMEEQFRDLDAILVAEHGYFLKYPEADWKENISVDLAWKAKIRHLLENYVDRCKGSLIEEKHASLVWHYRNSDKEIASLRIIELKDDLYENLKNEPNLTVIEGEKVLEVKSILYDKGSTAAALMSKVNYDFIIALGDDSTDEDLFDIIPEYGFTIRVGNKPTKARLNVRNQSQIFKLLNIFSRVSSDNLK